jgi:hypothetical protein
MNRMIDIAAISNFIFAGKATFTVRSATSGKHWTFRIKRKKDSDIYFVSLLTGSNNDEDYSYLGYLKSYAGDISYNTSPKSCRKREDAAHSVIQFLLNSLEAATLHPKFELYHEGKCARCGRTLTDPNSIERGLGPECATRI